MNARKPANYKKDPLRDQALVLRALGTRLAHRNFGGFQFVDLVIRVHNSFMLASAWRIIREYTLVFEEEYRLDNAVGDAGVRKELRNNDELRTEYLVLCDIAKTLVDIAQNKFSQLATQARKLKLDHLPSRSVLTFEFKLTSRNTSNRLWATLRLASISRA